MFRRAKFGEASASVPQWFRRRRRCASTAAPSEMFLTGAWKQFRWLSRTATLNTGVRFGSSFFFLAQKLDSGSVRVL